MFVKIVEVSPRDGLQNEIKTVPTHIKVEFINRLSQTGLKAIEVTSFVSPKWVPQLADHQEVLQKIEKNPGISYPVLIPNRKGLENAIASGVKEIAVFTTPSEQFSLRNTNCTVQESIERISDIMVLAKQHALSVRGYLSCVLGCPYQGEIDPQAVVDLADKLLTLGCYEISLGDTIGVGTASSTKQLLMMITEKMSSDKIAVHFHDTFGQALVNIYVALECGIRVIDSSVAGLGGCPYAKGASGNVATEDVLYLLNGLGIETGVDMDKLIEAGEFISRALGKSIGSKVGLALTQSANSG